MAGVGVSCQAYKSLRAPGVAPREAISKSLYVEDLAALGRGQPLCQAPPSRTRHAPRPSAAVHSQHLPARVDRLGRIPPETIGTGKSSVQPVEQAATETGDGRVAGGREDEEAGGAGAEAGRARDL
mmetsp:Transcript_32923/g.104090  ORF Transcript_32923/g.104090 Transcript_32923/m.104090 type:complete len:126 (+) Transcript_32923:309-686(+)